MAKIGILKRLVKEDFKKEEQELVSKLAFILNPAFEAIADALNKKLTIYDNFNMSEKDIIVTVDTNGTPTSTTSFLSGLRGSCVGIICIRAQDKTDPTKFVTNQPFISFQENSGLLTIQNVTGLIPGHKYLLRIIATV